MAHLPITGGGMALVDDEDFAWLNRHRWQRLKTHASRITAEAGKRRPVLMHREVARRAGLDIEGKQVDHINGDGLDNRRRNLRCASGRQNRQNQNLKRKGCSSRFKGVHWVGGLGWAAEIYVEGRCIRLGRFSSEEEAQLAYAGAAIEHFGEFAAPFVEVKL